MEVAACAGRGNAHFGFVTPTFLSALGNFISGFQGLLRTSQRTRRLENQRYDKMRVALRDGLSPIRGFLGRRSAWQEARDHQQEAGDHRHEHHPKDNARVA